MSPQAGCVLQDQVVPRLRGAIPKVVHCLGAEDHNELIQDATAMAAKMMHNVELAGKQVTPGNIAYYTIQHQKSGRRSSRLPQAGCARPLLASPAPGSSAHRPVQG